MYKVMIVDDERLIRITLKNMIDWRLLDCEVVVSAKDGIEAIAMFDAYQPEIVITDLKMPGMDGVELIRQIKEKNQNTAIIALSNYSDFEYVRSAMKAGAMDYLLKVSLDKQNLIGIIEQAKEHCVASNAVFDETLRNISMALQQIMAVTKREHIVDYEEYHRVLSLPCFKLYEEHYQMAYFRVDNVGFLYEEKIKDHSLLHNHLADLIHECIPTSIQHMLLFLSNHSGIILFNSDEAKRIETICHNIVRNIKQYLDIHISITLSVIIQGFDHFISNYLKVLDAHEVRFYEGEGVIIHANQVQPFQELNFDDLQMHLLILEAQKARDFALISQLQEKALQFMKQHYIRPQMVKEYFIFILNNAEGNEIYKGKKIVIQFERIDQRIRSSETIDKLNEVLEESFMEIQTWLSSDETNKYRKEILDVMEFVENNLDKRLTLRMIAEHFHLSESNLSRMFKNETGKNMNYYINEQKMHKAMEILTNDTKMIKDVAAQVGMDDQLYFNKVFKKFYHISPSAVKKHR